MKVIIKVKISDLLNLSNILNQIQEALNNAPAYEYEVQIEAAEQ